MFKIKSPIDPKNELTAFLECEDHTVSRETFTLLKDITSELLITYPQPDLEKISFYYESEDYISHTDAKKSLVDRMYQLAKKYTINKKVKMVKRWAAGNSILDIGCGTGDFLAACKKSGYKIVGVEPSEKARQIAVNKIQHDDQDQKTIYTDLGEISNSDKFDLITMWHVLEHVPNLETYIKKLKSLLKVNGVLLIAVPNYKSYDATYYKKYWAAYDVPRHLWHFSKKAIGQLFDREKMKVEKIAPMKLDAYYVSILSEKYKTGKSNLIKAFFVGLRSNLHALRTKEHSSQIYIIKTTKN